MWFWDPTVHIEWLHISYYKCLEIVEIIGLTFWNSSNFFCRTSTCSKSCPNSSDVTNASLSLIQNITSSHSRMNCTSCSACCSLRPFSCRRASNNSHSLCNSSRRSCNNQPQKLATITLNCYLPLWTQCFHLAISFSIIYTHSPQ